MRLMVLDETQYPSKIRAAVPGDVADPAALGVVHPQPTASAVWSVQHNLGTRRLDVTTFDEAGRLMIGGPRWSEATDNRLYIDFSRAVAGTAIIRPL